MLGFDCNTKLSYEKAKELKAKGYEFAMRYVGRLVQSRSIDIDVNEVENILSAGLKLGIVQHCPQPGWVPDKELGTVYGKNAVKFSDEAGVERGTSVYLDLEGIKPGTPKSDIIDFCNAWYDEVNGNFTAGVYVGFNSYLTGSELYYKLKFKHYWKSFSKVPTVFKRGYEMFQVDYIKDECGIELDTDNALGDILGNKPQFMERSDSEKLKEEVIRLRGKIAAIQKIVEGGNE